MLSLETLPVWLSTGGGALLGLVVGSFLNVVIHRLPRMMESEWRAQCAELNGKELDAQAPYNLAHPASHCPQCQHRIRIWENIPLLSYALLRGRCSNCAAAISARYPAIEAACGLLSAGVIFQFGPTLAGAAALIFVWVMLALSAIDIDTQLLPDSLTLPLLWAGLLLNIGGTFTSLTSAVTGAAIGYLSLWSVYWLFKLLTGKEGMGFGDFKLLAAIGAWLGWTMLPLVILLSSLVGAIVGISLMLFRSHQRDTPIPFGPYLAAAGVIALFWGQPLTQTYLRLLDF